MVVRLIVSSTSGFSSAVKSCSREFRASVSVIALLCGLGCSQPSMAQSLPTGGTVASGNVAIGSTSPTSLTVTQSSSTSIVNWSSFSVGQGHQVQFNNGSGATLNRVTGNVPSSINGVVSATGSVYLVNPSGVVVGPSGVVKTGGSFVASTLDVKDAEFRAGGSLTFSGNSNASVVNLGKIGALKGDVVLIARQVRNDGSLTARNGTAAMASGSEVVLSDGSLGNGKVLVRRPAQDGEIRNSGAIRATEVELRANGGNIYALAGNTGRAITATGVASKGGRIFLTAEGGSVNVTQKVVARRVQANVVRAGITSQRGSFTGGDVVVSGDKVVVGGTIEAKGNGGAGGTVVVTGTNITLTSGAAIDASGTSGGTVLIGGDRAGGSDAVLKFLPQTIANAQSTTIEAGATITADGTSGAGGNVVVWSDGTTSFGGAISTQGLHGGFIETSGHVFNFTGGSVNAGRGGAWLLDPVDLTIDATLAGTIATALNGGSNVTQQTSATGSGGNGDITVASGINWSNSATLTLSAYRNIAVNANIASTGGGGVVLRADNAGTGTGTVTFGGGQISTAGTVSIFYNPTGDSSTINATKYTAPTQTDFSGNVTGGATLNTTMLVNNVYDLQNMKNNLASTYALGRDIDAAATASWNGGAGFSPIGDYTTQFTGSLDGQGRVISNLAIDLPYTNHVGLFGYTGAGAVLSNVSLQAATVAGAARVGILVGLSKGTISNASATGTVTADSYGGGLAGESSGSVASSWAAVTVAGTTTTSSSMGGLIGWNNTGGTIQDSYATGNVTAGTGSTRAGGLAGNNNGSILRSYATGAVSGGSQGVGGLVGFNSGTPAATIVESYATGAVTATALGGGLVGINSVGASVSKSYATGAVTAAATATASTAGGLIGSNSGAVAQSYATGAVNATSALMATTVAAGGLIGTSSSTGTVTQSYATGAAVSVITVSGTATAGGLIGRNVGGASVMQSYATGAATATAAAGTAMAGGLIGNYTSMGTVTQTYATGVATSASPSGTAVAGGLIGSATGAGAITSSYWDTVTSGRANAVGSGTSTGITGLTTSQMQNPSNYASTYVGWDFATVWSAPSAGYYPQLYGVNYVLRVDPANASRVYGDANPAFTYSIYGLHAGDTSGIITGLSVSTAATSLSNVGNYAITASGSAVSVAGQAYRFIDVPGTLTVTPRAITVTADTRSRAYGDANPALTYQVGGAGLANGDTLSGALVTIATTTSNIGVYGITQGTLAASTNYTVSLFTGANLTVTPRAITVTADATSRAYGDANPALTYRVGGSGLANGDTLSGALATSATAASDVGVYGITQGSLAASSNYAFTFVGANLTITPVAPQVPTERPGAYARSSVPAPAPQPSGQKFESESIEEPSAAMICKSEPCLKLPHPDNRRIGARARFVDTMTDRNRLPASLDN
jgi:filamentous hemagglutinin family protein